MRAPPETVESDELRRAFERIDALKMPPAPPPRRSPPRLTLIQGGEDKRGDGAHE